MWKETEEITAEAVGQPMAVNEHNAKRNLCLRFLSKLEKKSTPKPLSVLSRLISLLKRERFVIL